MTRPTTTRDDAEANGAVSIEGTRADKPMGGGDNGAPLASMPVTDHGSGFAEHAGGYPDERASTTQDTSEVVGK